MHNSNQEDRRRLMEALWSRGYSVSEYSSGGGTVHVVLPLLEEGEDMLFIATGDIDSNCDISLIGWHGGEQVQTDTWISVSTLEEAVLGFERFLSEQNVWLERFRSGELDM